MKRKFIGPVLLSVLAAIWLAGCQTTGGEKTSEPTVQKYWPAPPDLPRFAMAASFRNELDLKGGDEEDSLKRLLVGETKAVVKFMKPNAIEARDGRIYLADTALKFVHVLDLAKRRYFRLGYRLEGQLAAPRGMDSIESGELYVTDQKQQRVVIYDSLGLYKSEISLEGAVDKLVDVAVDRKRDRIYVLDSGGIDSDRHRVLVLDLEGRQLQEIGRRGSEPGQFNLPKAMVVNSRGELLVLDAGNFRVQVFSPEGDFLRQWGRVGRGLGQFSRPRDIAVDGQDNVYVSDANFTNVQVFDTEGRLLMPIGKRSLKDCDGLWALVSGLDVDERGNLYVVDQAFQKVEVLRPVSREEGERVRQRFR